MKKQRNEPSRKLRRQGETIRVLATGDLSKANAGLLSSHETSVTVDTFMRIYPLAV